MKKFLGLKLPLFMPDATLGAVRTITTDQLEQTGTEMLVVNTLHLLTSYGVDGMKKAGGVAFLMDWKGKILSDSGGFQVFSLVHRNPKLGKITAYGVYFKSPRNGSQTLLTPEISIDMQVAMGTDALVVLDDCRASNISRKDAELSVRNTTKWAERAKKHFTSKYPKESKERKLFGVVQGANFKDLREQSAKELMKIGFDGYCFGGWPVNSSGKLDTDIIGLVSDLIPDDLLKYAMGIGTPDDIRTCRKLGYDLFDCVLPTRNARHGLLYTSEGKIRITKSDYKFDSAPLDPSCSCPTCKRYSRAYIHHLFRSGELSAQTHATIHNLHFYAQLMKELQG